MQSKAFTVLALSAAAVSATPYHKRHQFHSFQHHGTASGVRPTGSGVPMPSGNDTNGYFPPSGSGSILPVTQVVTVTVSPLPGDSDAAATGFNNVVDASSSTSCVSTSIATEFSTNFVTVTASGADLAATKVADVSGGGFYQGSRTWGGGWGQSSSGGAVAPTGGNPSTTFATGTRSSAVAGTGSATSSAVATATGGSGGGSSGGKRGISYNEASLVSAFGNSVSWAYNWAATADGSPGVEFVPMMWGKDSVSGFADSAQSASHVLSFNEPDLAAQADIDPQTAAQLHIEGTSGLPDSTLVGSPAVTNGDSTSPAMGIPWLNQWFEACAGKCRVDFVAFHWYAGADQIEYFKQHVDDVIAAAAAQGISKVWLTEFKPDSGDDAAQASFMSEAVAYLDSQSAVERYAGFMASDGTMLNGGSLNNIGSAYAGA